VCTVVVRYHVREFLELIPEFILPSYLLTCDTDILVVALLILEFQPCLSLMPVDDFLHPILLIECQTTVLIVELRNVVAASARIIEGRGLNVSTLRSL
jgi:hypothetical protein